MKSAIIGFLFSGSLLATSVPLPEIDLPTDGYDISTFRKYSEMKGIPELSDGSVRVFYMHQGRVSSAIEISLASGDSKMWPDWFEDSAPVSFRLERHYLEALSSSLVDSDLDSIPKSVIPSFDGSCHLLEVRRDGRYYWRLHRNSSSGYFKAIVALVEIMVPQKKEK